VLLQKANCDSDKIKEVKSERRFRFSLF